MDLLTNMTKAPVRMQVVGVTETLMPMEREPVSRCLQTGLIRGGMRADVYKRQEMPIAIAKVGIGKVAGNVKCDEHIGLGIRQLPRP